jgi:hypothetical protein
MYNEGVFNYLKELFGKNKKKIKQIMVVLTNKEKHMKINRVAEEKIAPSWAFGSKSLDDYEKNKAILKNEVERINITPNTKVSEDVLAKECEEIEKRAASGKPYHYNSTWSEDSVKHLKEYASACGMKQDKVTGVNPEALINDINEIERKANEAFAPTKANEKNKLVLPDPFHIDERSDMSHMEKKNWERVGRQANMKDAPVMEAGVRPLRGGEDYFANSESKTAKNQNSITNPDAIKQFAESEKLDTGARLKKEKADRITARKDANKEWEQNVIKAMEKNDIVPKGTVFPTEVLNAQPGLNTPSSQMGVYSKMDKKDIPEQTAGEKVREARKQWNSSIKRPEKEKAKFEMSKSSERGISDTFGDELKKLLKK